jgi:hypothetical protein
MSAVDIFDKYVTNDGNNQILGLVKCLFITFWRDNVFGIDEIGGHTGVNVTSQGVM